jgi:hypothetical protein
VPFQNSGLAKSGLPVDSFEYGEAVTYLYLAAAVWRARKEKGRGL